MRSKLLLAVLVIGFMVGIVALAIFYKTTSSPTISSLPLPKPTLTPVPSLMPTPADPYTIKGIGLIDDLNKIKDDLLKVQNEDRRLIPPEFIFEKNIPQ